MKVKIAGDLVFIVEWLGSDSTTSLGSDVKFIAADTAKAN